MAINESNLIQLFFDDVMCFVDLNTGDIYSAKLKKMKGQTLKGHIEKHYMIKYNNHKKYMSHSRLIEMAKAKKGL